jgi:transcriptional regulator with XRE-family HTH domain
METINEKIPRMIKDALETQSKTQRDLANELGMSEQNIYSYLSGARGKFSPVLLRMLDAVGLELVVKSKK